MSRDEETSMGNENKGNRMVKVMLCVVILGFLFMGTGCGESTEAQAEAETGTASQ